jgi:hypothetical protein
MEYITSRPYELPSDPTSLNREFFFNLWGKRLWPYSELEAGDILYWYWSAAKTLVWRSRTVDVDRFPYEGKDSLRSKLEHRFGPFDPAQEYFVRGTESGFCLAYRVQAIGRLALPKPDSIRFPQQGWLKVERPEVVQWVSQPSEAA